MARPRKYTDQQLISALREMKGMVYLAAAKVGCTVNTIYNRARFAPAVARCIQDERGKVVDLAELKLYKAVEKGEPWAVQLTLKTLGRARGYAERQEVGGGLGVRLELVQEIVEAA